MKIAVTAVVEKKKRSGRRSGRDRDSRGFDSNGAIVGSPDDRRNDDATDHIWKPVALRLIPSAAPECTPFDMNTRFMSAPRTYSCVPILNQRELCRVMNVFGGIENERGCIGQRGGPKQ